MFVPLTPIRCLYRAMDLYASKVGVVCGASRFTSAQFGDRCERLAAGLQAEGIGKGDRIAYLSFNNNQLLEGYFGIPLARAIVAPLNVRLTPVELIEILNHSGTRLLIFENDFAPYVNAFRKNCLKIHRFVSIEGNAGDADLSYEELISKGRIDRPDLFSFDENEIAEVFYTSGSTGTPKGVALSHRTLYLQALCVAGSLSQGDREVELHTIPLFHANGWSRPQTSTINGLKQVMDRRFETSRVLKLIERERASDKSMVL